MRQGPVVYLSAEGTAGLRYRCEAWRHHHQCEYPEDCIVLPYALDLPGTGSVDEVLTTIRDHLGKSPALIVIDTLARYFGGGNESATQDMKKVRLSATFADFT